MAVALISHERCLEHIAGSGHPERPGRLTAARQGLLDADLLDAFDLVEAAPVGWEQVALVHEPALIARLQATDAAGGGRLDPDTKMNEHTLAAARLAAGAGLDAVDLLDAGSHDSAVCMVRPPGHHATPMTSMGFCFINNVAVTAAALADRGERVAIVDFDAHHGNGTQDIFYTDDRVLFVSLHQYPYYPGTGALEERGSGAGVGYTVNIPLPALATGDVYCRAFDEVVLAALDDFDPDWLLVSAGFDAHRADPLTQMGLSAGDFVDMMVRLAAVAPSRLITFLEGGYDADALARSFGAAAGVLAGVDYRPETATSGGPGADVVDAARALMA